VNLPGEYPDFVSGRTAGLSLEIKQLSQFRAADVSSIARSLSGAF
jgi:hypothetical protein